MKLETQKNLAELTWWKVGGNADHFVMPESISELEKALEWAEEHKYPVTVIGGGSNVLISDEGIEGLVICMKKFKRVTFENSGGRLVVTAESGALKADVLKPFLQEKLAPALFLCGLPGDMAGGVVMNAGVSEPIVPREFVEIVDWFEVVRRENVKCETLRFENSDIQWEYRHTSGWQPGVITRVCVSWPLQPDEEMGKKVKQATRTRLMKQPLNMPSCGSVFKNPEGNSSGALIEKAGLKGFQIGDAQVSEKHANFIVNLGQAKASDILKVIQHVQVEVKKQFDIELRTEVKKLGRW